VTGSVCRELILPFCGESAAFVHASVLDAELKKKFVGTEDTRKGVRQLVDAIQKLFGPDAHDQASGIDLETVENVIPVSLTRGDIGSAFNLDALLEPSLPGNCETKDSI